MGLSGTAKIMRATTSSKRESIDTSLLATDKIDAPPTVLQNSKYVEKSWLISVLQLLNKPGPLTGEK
jgi:hypothetical protein